MAKHSEMERMIPAGFSAMREEEVKFDVGRKGGSPDPFTTWEEYADGEIFHSIRRMRIMTVDGYPRLGVAVPVTCEVPIHLDEMLAALRSLPIMWIVHWLTLLDRPHP